MDDKRNKKLKAKLYRLWKKANVGQKIVMYADGKVYGEYDVMEVIEPDMKTPQEWLLGNICFAQLNGFKELDIELV